MDLCHSLIDALAGQDVVDAARDYAQHIPMRVIADILGFPPQDAPQFHEFVTNTLEGINLPPQAAPHADVGAVPLPARAGPGPPRATRATTSRPT